MHEELTACSHLVLTLQLPLNWCAEILLCINFNNDFYLNAYGDKREASPKLIVASEDGIKTFKS